MLEQMFNGIRQNTDWHIDGDLLWGYFFTDTDPDKLKAAADKLAIDGYHFVKIFEAEGENETPLGYFILHVEKIETHTVDSLFARNEDFYAFAEMQELDTYDGMDVGPVEDD